MLTLEIWYQLAHRETENEIFENLTQQSEGHAEHAEQKIRYSLKQVGSNAVNYHFWKFREK